VGSLSGTQREEEFSYTRDVSHDGSATGFFGIRVETWRLPTPPLESTPPMRHSDGFDAHELHALKSDAFGRIALMQGASGLFVRRNLRDVPTWLRWLAWWLARREARALKVADGLPAIPRLLGWNGNRLDRSHLEGVAMHQRPPQGNITYFHRARHLLQQLHRRGIAHNDLAKEANWLVLTDGTPAIIDFQLAICAHPRSRWMRLLAREDLRHLLKHKRTYCPRALTPIERRLLARRSWLRDVWFATGKPVYRFVTRRVLKWRDNEGRGPRA
jgi:hypothetical protein